MKSYCIKCKYWRPSWSIYGECVHPSNMKEYEDFLEKHILPVKSPLDLNMDNDCKNYKYSRFRHIINKILK